MSRAHVTWSDGLVARDGLDPFTTGFWCLWCLCCRWSGQRSSWSSVSWPPWCPVTVWPWLSLGLPRPQLWRQHSKPSGVCDSLSAVASNWPQMKMVLEAMTLSMHVWNARMHVGNDGLWVRVGTLNPMTWNTWNCSTVKDLLPHAAMASLATQKAFPRG